MIAIAGTHGKTTTTAMAIWLCKQAGNPISYSVGAKVSFGSMAEFNRDATFFVYEADEFDRNFLSFSPALSIISGIGYDHPDIYPTIEAYNEAFIAFIEQSDKTILWQQDYKKLGSPKHTTITVLPTNSDTARLQLPGTVNRQNAFAVARGFEAMGLCDFDSAIAILQKFPGVSRRFEKIADNLYSDYAHTPEKIAGALQIAQETTNTDFVVCLRRTTQYSPTFYS